MRAELVALLSTTPGNLPIPGSIGALRDREAQVFAEAYRSLDYGWRSANELVKQGRRLPNLLDAEDEWLWRAWRHLSTRQNGDPVVNQALSLRHPRRATERHILEALLLALETPTSTIGDKTGLGQDVVDCYGALFYSVRSRAEDQLLIATLVYPDTRLVEMYDRYLETESFANLLKRSAYNNGLEDVLYFAGLSVSNGMQGVQASALSNSLEQQFMANALMLAKNGWLNAASNNRGLLHAKGLMAAAKQGGVGVSESLGSQLLGDTLRQELTQIRPVSMRVVQAIEEKVGTPRLAPALAAPQDHQS